MSSSLILKSWSEFRLFLIPLKLIRSLKLLYDIRIFQILIMGSLLSAGVLSFDFSLQWQQIIGAFVCGIFCQYLWIKKLNLKISSLFSALITCLSVALLLRANDLWVHPVTVILSLSSKFLIQKDKRHFINPSVFGIVCALLFFPHTWLSSGQWGSLFLTAVWIIAFGSLITVKVRQIDISWIFLSFYLGAVGFRNLWLGYEIEIFLHTALNGSLLLFTFFMISDPKTSPNHFIGKLIQAFFVAFFSFILHYYFYINNGFIYSLFGCSLFTPILNKLLKAKPFEWRKI